MIRVRVLRSTVGDGGRVLAVGELLSLPAGEARDLIALRKVEAILNLPDHDADGGAPEPEHRDPAPRRTRGAR